MKEKMFWIVFLAIAVLSGIYFTVADTFGIASSVVNKHQITLAEADELTSRFQEKSSEGTTFGFEQDGELFSDVTGFVRQTGLTSLKIMYGLQTDGRVVLVVFGYDESGNMLDIILEKGAPCPPYCSDDKSITERR